jgi:hypothetical protein
VRIKEIFLVTQIIERGNERKRSEKTNYMVTREDPKIQIQGK